MDHLKESASMTYSTELEEKIDRLTKNLGKKKMFGGICYLLHGNMCFGIHKESLMIRTTVDNAAKLMADRNFLPFDITGRPMKGWVMVSNEYLKDDDQLKKLLTLGTDLVNSLPKK